MTQKVPFIFVLMPFDPALEDMYRSGIRLACEYVGIDCARVDDQNFDEPILQRIYDQIGAADAIVADMTGRNANVFYEVGYAHALKKRVILLTQDATEIPFDLRHHPHIVYEGKAFILRDQLIKKLNWYFPPVDQQGSVSTYSPTVQRITRILARVSKTLGAQESLQPLLDTVVEEMMHIFDAEVCSIFLNSPEDPNILTCVAGSGFAAPLVDVARYGLHEGFTGSVFSGGKTRLISSASELRNTADNRWKGKYDELQFGGSSQFRNCVAAPLAVGDTPLGVIKVENKRAGTFTEEDVAILESITSGVLPMAIQNARARKSSLSV